MFPGTSEVTTLVALVSRGGVKSMSEEPVGHVTAAEANGTGAPVPGSAQTSVSVVLSPTFRALLSAEREQIGGPPMYVIVVLAVPCQKDVNVATARYVTFPGT